MKLQKTIVFGLLVLLAALPAEAKKRRSSKKLSGNAWLGVITTPGANEAMVRAVERLVDQAMEHSAAPVLRGAALKRKIDRGPKAAAKRCGGAIPCLANLARKARVYEIVYAAARTEGALTTVDFRVITSGGKLRVRRSLDFQQTGDVRPIVSANYKDIFRLEFPPDLPDVQELEPDLVGLDEPALAGPEDIPALQSPNAGVMRRAKKRSKWLLWTGVAVGTVGAVTLGTGALFGVQSNSKFDDQDACLRDPTCSAEEATAFNQDGNDLVSRANLLYAVGGSLVVVGLGAILVDAFVIRPQGRTTASFSVDDDGAWVGANFKF